MGSTPFSSVHLNVTEANQQRRDTDTSCGAALAQHGRDLRQPQAAEARLITYLNSTCRQGEMQNYVRSASDSFVSTIIVTCT